MKKQIEDWLDFLLSAGAIKRLPRTGWRLAGIQDCESVADHSFRVALVALLLGDLVEGIDRQRLLRMSLVHDLPEAVVTDLPKVAVQLIGRATKRQAESEAWNNLVPAGELADGWRALWEEYEEAKTAEARLARFADRFERLLQAYQYQRSGFRDLDTFWEDEELDDQGFEPVRLLWEALWRRRAELAP